MCLTEFVTNYTARSGQELAEDETTDALRMVKVEDVKASNPRVPLDACTSAREKPSFASIDSTMRKSQSVQVHDNAVYSLER